MEATIFNIQKFSTEDGPGIRTTVFFKGCPMRCPWCHNPESLRVHPEVVWHSGRCIRDGGCIKACPNEALSLLNDGETGVRIDRDRCEGCGECVDFCPASALEIHGRRMRIDEVFDAALRDQPFYESSEGGVTLSGGEPLVQPEAALALMRMLRGAEVHVALDTCGAVPPDVLREALTLSDLVLLDIKTTDPVTHEQFTGFPFARVAEAARAIEESGVPVWVRTPVIPGYTADEETMRGVARFVRDTFTRCERHDLLAFSNLCTSKYEQLEQPFALQGVPLIEAETMDALCEAARATGSVNARWSGPTRLESKKGGS